MTFIIYCFVDVCEVSIKISNRKLLPLAFYIGGSLYENLFYAMAKSGVFFM